MTRDKKIDIPESEMGMSMYSKFSWKLWEKGLCNMSEAEQADQIMREMGYRKASEVAREIFEEIEKYNRQPLPECEPIYVLRKSEFAKLKRKYGYDTN